MKKYFPLISFFILFIVSCGNFQGFDKFSEPETGNALKLKLTLTDTALDKLYSSVTKPEGDYVKCMVESGSIKSYGKIKIRGLTSRAKPKKNFSLKIIKDNNETAYALSSEAGTWLKNRIIMHAYKTAGLEVVQITKAAALFINDEYIGYYSMSEMYSEENLSSLKNSNNSELYKIYLSSYYEYPLSSRCEKKFPDNNNYSSLDILINKLNHLNGDEWENWVTRFIDIDSFINYMAVHDFFAVTDTEVQNFYIYFSDKYRILPWDNELSMNINYYNLFGHNKLTEKILSIPSVREKYIIRIKELFIDTPDFSNMLLLKLDEYYKESKDAVKSDPSAFLSYEDFESVHNSIIYFINKRPELLENYLEL